MKLPIVYLRKNYHDVLQVTMFACQFLVPSWVPMTHEHQISFTGFLSAVQTYFGYCAIRTNPDGTPSIVPPKAS